MRDQIVAVAEKYLGRGKFSGGENMSVKCPFHKGGEESKPSFSLNVGNGVWHCFTCKVSGPLPLLLRLLGLPRNVIDAELKDLRAVLLENAASLKWKKRAEWLTKDPFLADTVLPETILKPYELCPTKLVDAGFDPAWLQWMDVGFDRNNDRITYPIRDMYGNLAGISGGAALGQFPKYKVYQGRKKEYNSDNYIESDYGPWFDELYPNYHFHNHKFLWNFDQVYPRLFFSNDTQWLIITEGFKACLWMLQHGWANTVALMGSSMSDHQRNLLHRLKANVLLFLDNDEAGQRGTDKIAKELRKFQPGILIARYPGTEAMQPDDLTPEELSVAITGAYTYPEWKEKNKYVNGWTQKRRTEHQQQEHQ